MLVCQVINIITIITSSSSSSSRSRSRSRSRRRRRRRRRRLIIILLVYLFIYVFICLLFSDGFSLHIREGKSILKKGKGFSPSRSLCTNESVFWRVFAVVKSGK